MNLNGKKVAILATDGFEESELTQPKEALENAGATVHIVSPKSDSIKSWDVDDWGKDFSVDQPLNRAKVNDYDLLVLPGGQINPDKLRVEQDALDFIKHFRATGKPIGAICHAPWLLAETGIARGRKLTSFKSIKTDLKNAGAHWVDEPVVVDDNLITSRNPNDLPNFNEKLLEALTQERITA